MDHGLVDQSPNLAAAVYPPLAKRSIFRRQDPVRINVGETLQHRPIDALSIIAILVRAADDLGQFLRQFLERLSPNERNPHPDPSCADKPIFDDVLALIVPL